MNSKRNFLAGGLALALAGCSGAVVGTAPGTTAANAGGGAQLRTTVHPSDSTLPTLYVLNGYSNKTDGWVSAYSDAGATLTRNFGTIGSEFSGMTADASGHLYLYPGLPFGQILVYKNYGAAILQTRQFQKSSTFTNLTLSDSGNLFGMATNRKFNVGQLDEFLSNGNGSLKQKPIARPHTAGLYVATDSMGDVGSAYGVSGFKAYAGKSKTPFWTLNAPNTGYASVAFDSSNNLYVVQYVVSSGVGAVSVYARGASAPTYSITNGVYQPSDLAFDGSGNLYVFDICPSNCGSNPSEEIAVYTPGATSPNRVLQPLSGKKFGHFAVSSSGYVAAVEFQNDSENGPVVVYAPGSTVPTATISTGLQAPDLVVFGD